MLGCKTGRTGEFAVVRSWADRSMEKLTRVRATLCQHLFRLARSTRRRHLVVHLFRACT